MMRLVLSNFIASAAAAAVKEGRGNEAQVAEELAADAE